MQSRTIIEKQIYFINDNPLIMVELIFMDCSISGKRKIRNILFREEKITQSYPLLSIEIDPPYFIETESEVSAPLIIRNEGNATAEGYFLKIKCESTEYEGEVEIPFETNREFPSKDRKNFLL